MKTHYRLSPSGASRWLTCTASLMESAKAPDRPSSAYAEEGTRAHAVAEAMITGADIDESEYDEEMLRAGRIYAEEVNSWRSSRTILLELTEQTLTHREIEGFGGTADHAMVYIEGNQVVLHVFDFKYGAGVPVSPENNKQLLSYFAVIDSHLGGHIDHFRGSIIQPRTDGDDTATWAVDRHEVEAFVAQVKDVLNQPPRYVTGEHCRWCPALTICGEVERKAREAAVEDFKNCVDLDRLKELYELLPALRALIEAIPERMLEVFRSGEKIDGFKVIERLSHRKWSLGEECTAEALESLGLSRESFEERKLKSPAQIEKLLPKERRKHISELTKRFAVGYSVVPENTKGEPIDFTKTEFSKISEDFNDGNS